MNLTYDVQRVFRKLTRTNSPESEVASEHMQRPDYSLSEPLVTLYVSATAKSESAKAFDLLTTMSTGFRVEVSPDDSIGVEFAGQYQHGLEGVQRLRDGIIQFKNTLLQPGADLDAARATMHRPGVREQANRELEEQRHHAFVELNKILK